MSKQIIIKKKLPMVNAAFRIPWESKQKLELVSLKLKISQSNIIRDLIDHWLKEN